MRRLLIAAAALVLAVAPAAEAIDFTPTGSVITVTYTEPTQNTDNSSVNDLAKTTISWRVCPTAGACTGAFTTVDVPASALTGGGAISRDVTVPVAPGVERNVEIFATATDTSGNLSPETPHIVKRVDRLSPKAPA
jgi:hypothetical protein